MYRSKFILLVVLGFLIILIAVWLVVFNPGVRYNFNDILQNITSLRDSTKNPNEGIPQKFSDLEWKNYKDTQTGISFSYPINLMYHTYFEDFSKERDSLLVFGPLSETDTVKVDRIYAIRKDWGNIVYIQYIRNYQGSIEEWINRSHYRTGYQEKTTLNNYPAILYKIKDDVPIIPVEIYHIKISNALVVISLDSQEKNDTFSNKVRSKIIKSLKL